MRNMKHLRNGKDLFKWILLFIALGGFYTYNFVDGVGKVNKRICFWLEEVSTFDTARLRERHHRRYREQMDIIDFVRKIIPEDESLLIKNKGVALWFVAYFAAPRPVYHYSEELVDELNESKHNYYVIEMQQNDEIVDWSLINYRAEPKVDID